VSDLITHTARLVPYVKRPKQVASFVTAYTYEPLPDEPGAELGNLYVVMEVLVSGRASEEVADLVIETIGDQYYNQATPGSDSLERFEAAVKACNHELSEHVNRGNAAWIGKLSAVVAIQVGGELHVAHTGSAEAFLYRGKASTHVTTTGPSRPTTPSKTFGSIASGQLEEGDRFLLATPALIHQVPLERLSGIISHTGPNSAIAEIQDLLKGTSVDRIAALVIEVITPESAALQVRSEQPSEIQLGSPENALDAAKLVAAPIAQSTLTSSKKVVHAAHTGFKRAKPHARAAGLAAVDVIRRILSSSKGRRRTLVISAVVILAISLLIWNYNSSAQATKYFTSYQAAYQEFARGQGLLDQGSKTDAHSVFNNVRGELSDLKSHERTINSKLAHTAIPESEPKTFNALMALVNDRLDEIDGLVKVNPVTVAKFTAKNAKFKHFELFGDKAYAFDEGNSNALSIVTVSTGAIRTSKADFTKLGVVSATTISGSGDGIYILTDKPSVWFYRFDTDSITQQPISYGSWPKSTAIASYASNIYLLGDSAVYKHLKTSTGFSPKSDFINTTSETTRDSTSLAVDGSVYLISTSGLHRYVGGTLKQSAPLPDTLVSITNLRSTADGSVIIGTSADSKRVGVWVSGPTSLAFSKQVALSDIKSLYDATYDGKSGNVYALVDGRLVRFTIKP
jgi:hypothetical protein